MVQSVEARRRPGQADIKVIGAGLPRTGTTSMKQALQLVLKGRCHHFDEIITDMDQSAFWLAAYEVGHTPEEWDAFFSAHGYVAMSDAPSCDFVKELADLYPEAKIVLTTRSADKWYKSMMSTIGDGRGPTKYKKMWYDYLLPQYKTFEAFRAFTFFSPQGVCRGQPLTADVLPKYVQDLTTFLAIRGESDRLLIYDIETANGFEDLCPFLGVPIPDTAWPHTNWSVQPGSTNAQGDANTTATATATSTGASDAPANAHTSDFAERQVYAKMRRDFRRARRIERTVTTVVSLTAVLGLGAIFYSRLHRK